MFFKAGLYQFSSAVSVVDIEIEVEHRSTLECDNISLVRGFSHISLVGLWHTGGSRGGGICLSQTVRSYAVLFEIVCFFTIFGLLAPSRAVAFRWSIDSPVEVHRCSSLACEVQRLVA